MIDLTPLDVRNKRSDFKKILRGYDPQEVDVFLEMVAERLEALVRENIQFRDRSELLQQQVSSSTGRERAVQEALVTAQELRADIRAQAQREAELIIQEAQAEARRRQVEAERKFETLTDALAELERRRIRFLKGFRQLLERELDGVEVEEARAPLEEHAIEMQLGGGRAEEEADGGVEGDDAVSGGMDTAFERADHGQTPETDSAPRHAADADPPEAPVAWDAPVHDLAKEHENPSAPAPEPRREGDLFSLPDLPLPDEGDDAGRP